MRQILGYLKYDSSPVKQGILYSAGDPFLIDGDVEFCLFGKAKLNGSHIQDTTIKMRCDQVKLVLEKSSSVVFYKVPTIKKAHPENEPVPDIPDYEDQAHASIAMMVEEVLRQKGLLAAGEAKPSNFDELFDEFDDDDYEGAEIDEYTLFEDPNRETPDLLQNRLPGEQEDNDSNIPSVHETAEKEQEIRTEPSTEKTDNMEETEPQSRVRDGDQSHNVSKIAS